MPLSALSKLSEEKNKPSLVYVYRSAEQDNMEELEKGLFGTLDIVLASRFFRCYRIADTDLPNDKIKSTYLRKKGPTLIILDAKGNEILQNKKKATKSWVYSKLKKQFSKDFGEKIAKHVKKLSDWLDDLEKADDKKADAKRLLATAQDRFDKRETPSSTKGLAKAKVIFKEVESAFAKMSELGEKLSNPQLKMKATAKR